MRIETVRRADAYSERVGALTERITEQCDSLTAASRASARLHAGVDATAHFRDDRRLNVVVRIRTRQRGLVQCNDSEVIIRTDTWCSDAADRARVGISRDDGNVRTSVGRTGGR